MRGADRVPRQSVLDHRATRHVTPGLQARAAERFDEARSTLACPRCRSPRKHSDDVDTAGHHSAVHVSKNVSQKRRLSWYARQDSNLRPVGSKSTAHREPWRYAAAPCSP